MFIETKYCNASVWVSHFPWKLLPRLDSLASLCSLDAAGGVLCVLRIFYILCVCPPCTLSPDLLQETYDLPLAPPRSTYDPIV